MTNEEQVNPFIQPQTDSEQLTMQMPEPAEPEMMTLNLPPAPAPLTVADEFARDVEEMEVKRKQEALAEQHRMQLGYEALSVNWDDPALTPEMRKQLRADAVAAFGAEWVEMFESSNRNDRQKALTDRYLLDNFTQYGDDISDPALRYFQTYGLDARTDIYYDVQQRFQKSWRYRQEAQQVVENMHTETMHKVCDYLSGVESMDDAALMDISHLLTWDNAVRDVQDVRILMDTLRGFFTTTSEEYTSSGLVGMEALRDSILNTVRNEDGTLNEQRWGLFQMAMVRFASEQQGSDEFGAGHRFASSLMKLMQDLDNAATHNALYVGEWGMADNAISKAVATRVLPKDDPHYQLIRQRRLEQFAGEPAVYPYRTPEQKEEARLARLRANANSPHIALANYNDPHFGWSDGQRLAWAQQFMAVRGKEIRTREDSSRKVAAFMRRMTNEAERISDDVAWYKEAWLTVAGGAPTTMLWMVPGGGLLQTAASYEQKMNENVLAGFDLAAARNRARADAGAEALAEMLPFSRAGGMGINAFLSLLTRGKATGSLTKTLVRWSSGSTGRAALLEAGVGFLDEAFIEPLAQGGLTLLFDALMDSNNMQHGQSRSFGEAFAELKEVWTDPAQLAAVGLFSIGVTGIQLPQLRQHSREFARWMRDNAQNAGVWQAMGLTDGEVRQVMESENPLTTGRELFHAALERDPEGLKKRMAKQGAQLQKEGFSLRLTGTTGELSADTETALAEAYREAVEDGVMPQVERIADRDGQPMYRLTERDRFTKEVVNEVEMTGQQADTYLQLRMAQVDARRVKRNQQTVYEDLSQHVEQLAGAAMTRELEQRGAAEGMQMVDMTELGAGVGEMVQQTGFMSYAAMQRAAEKLGGAWKRTVESFKTRARIAGKSANMIGSAAFREGHSSSPLPLNGKTIFGTIINYARGNVTPLEAMEESVETRSDMWLQLRALEIDGKSENPSAEAQKQALSELADVVRRARAELMKLEPGLQISEVPENAEYMDVIEAMSDMGRARLIASSLMPSWMHEVQDMVSSALDETAEAIRIAEAAKRASTEELPGWKQLEEIFASFDVPMGNVYSAARIDAAVIEQVRLARARVRGVAVATTAAEVQARQAEDVARDEAMEREEEAAAAALPEPPQAQAGKSAEEQTADMLANTPEAKAPTGMKGVFVRDACVYNEAGGFYVGCVPVRNLRDSKDVQQVKAGSKGKHGVVNPITGEYQQETEAIYVWRRKDGTLEVISGRHKFALALENGTESVICYVFNEDAQHDAKWARLLDFENNMRGDQADELTAAIYTRETGYDDATLRKKGLMRNKSKSKRGILIGREARQELWDRFINGAVSPMDAEIICQMTLGIRDKARVDEIQRRCCMLLEQGKSWEYISAMVQLMANKESVFMRQGLLDLGADFEADMERAASYVEKNVQKLTEAINVIKSGRRLSGEKKKLAERLGQFTTSSEASEALYTDLVDMRERFRNIGAYPDLVAAASMWDGKSELDPVEMARSYSRSVQEQAAAEANMTREEWEEAQAAKAAKQAAEEGTGSLFGMSASLRETRDFVSDSNGNLIPLDDIEVIVHEQNAVRVSEIINDQRYADVIEKIKASLDGTLEEAFVYRDLNDAEVQLFKNSLGFDFSGYAWQIEPRTLLAAKKQQEKKDNGKKKRGKFDLRLTENEFLLIPCIIDDIAERGSTSISCNVEELAANGTVFVEVSNPLTNTKLNFLIAPKGSKQDDRSAAEEKKKPKLSLKSVQAFLHRGAGLSPASSPQSAPPSGDEGITTTEEIKRNLLKQEFSSRDTSVNDEKVPAVFDLVKKADGWKQGTLNIDIGGGKYDTLTNALNDEGVQSYIYEPFGRTSDENAAVLALLQQGTKGDTATCSSVLNVIKEADIRANVIHQVAKAIKPNGAAYFTIYEGNGTGIGEETKKDCWQNNREAETYVDEIKQYFGEVSMNGKLIVAKKPLDADQPAVWRLGSNTEASATFSVIGEHARTWSKYKDKAFTGRDDGKMRAELDASKARIIAPTFPAITERAVRYTMLKLATDDERKLLDKYRRMKSLFDSYMKQLKGGTLTERQTNNWKAKSREIDDIRESLGGLVERTLNSLGYHASIQKFLPGIHRTYHPGIVEDVLDGRMEHLHDTLSRNMWVLGSTLEYVLDFPELYEAYPRLRDMEIKVEDTGDADAVFDPNDFSIALSYEKLERKLPFKKYLADILHEVQHAIQEIEGFAKGGSERQFRKNPDGLVNISAEIASAWMMKADRAWDLAPPETQKKFREINFAIIKKEYDKVNELEEALSESERAVWEEYREMKSNAYRATQDGGVQVTPYEAYYRLAGEIEARNVEHRMGWSAEGRAATPFNFTLDYSDGAIATFSLRDMTQAVRVMLRRREDDLEGEELIARWDELLARLETASVDRHDGAARLGVLVALLESTRSVLPPDFAKLGRLHALMKWAAVYAHLVSTGEVKRDGALKGAIFEQFVAAMQREYEGSLQKGLSEAEAREVLQELGERRLDEALLKVAKECRARLDVFVKARARERIELMAERAYPKKERGKKSPRGKMEAAYYRAMSTMLAWMDATPEEVAARVQELRARLEKLDEDADAEESGATRAELEEELRIVQLYGDWRGMSAGQARMAAEDFVTFVMTQRHAWDAKLEKERRRREWQRLRMTFRKPSNANTRSDAKREGGLIRSAGRALKAFVVNTMSYAQMMQAGRKVFGEAFTRSRLQEIADANAALRNARRERDDVFARALMEATGKTGEGELVRWLNRFGKVEKKTGIFKREVTRRTLEMAREEAEEWCAMTPQQRAARRRELNEEAERTGLAPQNVPTEADVEKLREELAAMEERGSKAQKLRVKVPRYGEKIELEASRDAVANAILLLEQEDYQHLIEHEGFTPRDKDGKEINRDLDPDTPLDVEQTLKPLYDFIGAEGRAFVYALRRYVGENGKRMQAVYEAHQGVPLAMKPNYWRGNFNINTIKEKDTLTDGNGAVGSGGGYGFLIDRVRHYNRLEWSNTATMVFGMTVEAQNNYTYTSGITREWRALLADTDFQKRLEVELGRPYMTALKEWLDIIDGVRRSSSPAMAWLGRMQQRMSRGLAYAALAGNGFVLVKQSSAVLHGLLGGEVPLAAVERGDGVRELTWRKIGVAEYAAAMARTKAGLGRVSLKELAACEWFKARTDSDYKNLARRMSLAEDKKQHAYSNKVADKTMDVIEMVDRGANLMGMQALADAVYRDMERINAEQNLGLTEEQIKREALAAVGRALSIAAQPHESSEKSLFAARGGIISNMLFQFKSETVNKMGLLFSRLLSGEATIGLRDYMLFGVTNAAIAAAIAWVRYGDDDEPKKGEEWKPYARFALNSLTGDLAAVPIIGDEIRRGTAKLTGEYYRQRGMLESYIDIPGVCRHVERIYSGEKARREMNWHDYVVEVNGLTRKLGVLSAFLGDGATWAELVLSAAAASNVIRTGADVVNGVARED